MFTTPAPSAPTLSTTTQPVTPASPPRTGRLRGLSYLRSYTHLHSSSSSADRAGTTSSANSAVPQSNSHRSRSQPGYITGSVDSDDTHSSATLSQPTAQPPPAPTPQRPAPPPSIIPSWSGTVGNTTPVAPSGWLPSSSQTTSGPALSIDANMTRNRAETVPANAAAVRSSISAPPGFPEDPLDPNHRNKPSIRFTPHQDPRGSRASLVFPATSRTLPNPTSIIRVGRYSERENPPELNPAYPSAAPVGFKSKVVSRRHCEFWCSNSQWYIKDVKSSSGTFLNHIRLSAPGVESRPYPVNDGDLVQLGIDYRGGEEMIYRCVKIRIECNRGWQKEINNFNKSTHKQLRKLAGKAPTTKAKDTSDTASTTSSECSICLMSIAPCQSLFVAPCSHVWHFKCIRPIVTGSSYPHFLCPNCRAVADLEADVDEPYEEWDDAGSDIAIAIEESKREAEGDSTTPRASIAIALSGAAAPILGNVNRIGSESTDDGTGVGGDTTRVEHTPNTAAAAVSATTAASSAPPSRPLASTTDSPSPNTSTTNASSTPDAQQPAQTRPPDSLENLFSHMRLGPHDAVDQHRPTPSSQSARPRPPPSPSLDPLPSPSPMPSPSALGAPMSPLPPASAPPATAAAAAAAAAATTTTGSARSTSAPVAVPGGGREGALSPAAEGLGAGEGPTTPRNDEGPFILDGGGSAGRERSRTVTEGGEGGSE